MRKLIQLTFCHYSALCIVNLRGLGQMVFYFRVMLLLYFHRHPYFSLYTKSGVRGLLSEGVGESAGAHVGSRRVRVPYIRRMIYVFGGSRLFWRSEWAGVQRLWNKKIALFLQFFLARIKIVSTPPLRTCPKNFSPPRSIISPESCWFHIWK